MSDSHHKLGTEPPGQPASEASIRQHLHLMEQMADREQWETDPLWLKAGRMCGATRIKINYEVGDEPASALYLGMGFRPVTTTAMYVTPG